MVRSSIIFLVLATLSHALPAVADNPLSLLSQVPRFQGLGDLPGGSFASAAFATSEDGAVVVGVSDGLLNFEAFRWTSGSGMVGLGDLPGGFLDSRSFATSADGTVVVGESSSFASGNSNNFREAFRWTAGGGIVGLGDLPGGRFDSRALDTSADGAIVVGWSETTADRHEAFHWTSGGGMVGMGDLPGGSFWSEANAISANGTVVVGWSDSVFGSGGEAFRWTAGGGMVGLGLLSSGNFGSRAKGISADGTVIVGMGNNSASGGEAFRWTAGGGMVGLGFLPGTNVSDALATSMDGSVVVGASRLLSGNQLGLPVAFLWTANDGMRLLQDILVTDFGLDLTGWQLQQANSISDDGMTIVGSGINPSGNSEAWVATIPEPSTLLLVFVGLSLYCRRLPYQRVKINVNNSG